MTRKMNRVRVVLNGVDISSLTHKVTATYEPMEPLSVTLELYAEKVVVEEDGTVVYDLGTLT